jgi:hypothetical protein
MAAQFVSDNPSATIRDVYNGDYVQGIAEKIKAFLAKLKSWHYSMPLIHRQAFRLNKYLMKAAAVMLSAPCETAKLLPPSACCWFACTNWQKGATV